MYIHQTPNWPHFSWNKDTISAKLAHVNKAAGYLAGRLSAIGFDVEKTRARDPLQRLHLTPRYENALTPLNEIKLTPTEKTLQGIFL